MFLQLITTNFRTPHCIYLCYALANP